MVEHHREELSHIRLMLTNKEADLYKMEQLLLSMNHQVDQSNSAREDFKIEADMLRVEKIRLEERSNYTREQFSELKE